jgi:putative intracellular protease/amidase
MRPPRGARPVIAILALNEATEVTDLLIPYGVLRRADVVDVTVIAERAAPVSLHPFSALGRGRELLRIEPQSTTGAFDERYPDGVRLRRGSRHGAAQQSVRHGLDRRSSGKAPRYSRSAPAL